MAHKLVHRLCTHLRRKKTEREMEHELQFHLEMETEENIRRGMSEEEARRAARRGFGGVEQAKEAYRDLARFRWIEDLWQDLRYGLRMLAKYPGFTLIATLTLAIGIGANTAIFSIVDGVLLRPLAFRDPDRLVKIFQSKPQKGEFKWMASIADFYEWKKQARSFEGMAALAHTSFRVTGGEIPEDVSGNWVSTDLFDLLGTRALIGRTFLPEDDRADADPVAILSHGYWVERHGADRNVIGKTITLTDEVHTIIGVLPENFRETFQSFPGRARIWTPSRPSSQEAARHGSGGYMVIARLKPHFTIEQAQTDMQAVTARLANEFPATNAGISAAIYRLHDEVTGGSRPSLFALLAAVGIVLLIVCANVAGLTLTKGVEREKEIAIRTALGAGRWRVVRQLLVENLLLAVLGGCLGALLAFWLLRAIVPLIPPNVPRTDEIAVNARTFLFTFAIALLTGMLSGLSPALQVTKLDLNEALKDSARQVSASRRRRFAQNSLVVLQIGLTLVLLAGAGLVFNSLVRFYRIDPGFDTRNLLSMQVSLPRAKGEDPKQWNVFWGRLHEQAQGAPGVEATAFVQPLPLGDSRFGTSIEVEGYVPANPQERLFSGYAIVSEGYFRLTGIRLLQGRYFGGEDRAGSPAVIVVNESFARQYFPGQNPLGKRVVVEQGRKKIATTIVGVAADSRAQLDRKPGAHLYELDRQFPSPSMYLLARTRVDPMSLAGTMREAVWSLNKNQPAGVPRSMDDVWDQFTAGFRFYLALLGGFALVALLLAAMGIYGVLSHAVSRRTHEIGIRLTLGAGAGDVLKLILRQGMVLTAMGLSIGLIAAWLAARLSAKLMKELVYEVSLSDPLTFATVAVLLAGVAMLACYLPARRATKVDPLAALHHE